MNISHFTFLVCFFAFGMYLAMPGPVQEHRQIKETVPVDRSEVDFNKQIVSISRIRDLSVFFERNGFFDIPEGAIWIVLLDYDGVVFPLGGRGFDQLDKGLTPIIKRLKAAGVSVGGLPLSGEKKTDKYLPAFNYEFSGFNFFLDVDGPFSEKSPRLLLKHGVVWNIGSSGLTKGRALRELLIFLRDKKRIDLKKVKLVFVDDSPANLKSAIFETQDLGLMQFVPIHYIKSFVQSFDFMRFSTYKDSLRSLYRNFMRFYMPRSIELLLP